MGELSVLGPPQGEGQRLDKVLPELAQLSRAAVQALCQEGSVLVNGRPAGKKQLLRAGERVVFLLPEPVELEVRPEAIPLDIVYEDSWLLVVNKPKGMVVHPAPGNYTGTLVNALLHHCKGSLSGINGVIRPGIVHRIDKDTRGWRSRFRPTASRGSTRPLSTDISGKIQLPSMPPSAAAPPTARRCASPRKTPKTPSPMWRFWGNTPVFPMCGAAWRQGAPTRYGCIFPTWATRCWGMWSTGQKNRRWIQRASASTPGASPLSIRRRGKGCPSPRPCRDILQRRWSSWGNEPRNKGGKYYAGIHGLLATG